MLTGEQSNVPPTLAPPSGCSLPRSNSPPEKKGIELAHAREFRSINALIALLVLLRAQLQHLAEQRQHVITAAAFK